jgi:curved DNA-binding protein CbpA
MSINLYETLQVSERAEPALIEAAYRFKLAKLDGKADENSQNELKILQWAYQTLIDNEKRGEYDAKLREKALASVYPEALYKSDFIEWWGTSKLTGVLIVTFLIIGSYMYLDYQKSNAQINAAKMAIQESSKNEGRAIDTSSASSQIEQNKLKMELDYRANANEQMLDLEQRRLDQQIELQKQQISMQKERQDQQIAMQQQQLEQQRIRREQQFYTCYNAAFDRFLGDGVRARATCAAYK